MIKKTVRLLLDESTQKILRLAVEKDYYPNQIAREIGLSNSLVVTRLKELERLGLLQGRFESKNGKAVKRYRLLKNELHLKIDLSNGKLSLREEEPSKIKEIVSRRPELFQGRENYLLWSSGKIGPREVVEYFNVSLNEAEEISRAVLKNLGSAFLTAYEARIKKWNKGIEGTFFQLVEDSLIIPTQRIGSPSPDARQEVIREISRGETYLSALKKKFPENVLEEEIKKLERRKIVVVEKQHVPQLNFQEIRSVTQEKLKKDKTGLFNLGKRIGNRIAGFIGGKKEIKGLFKDAEFIKTGKKEKIITSGYEPPAPPRSGKACYFIAGLIEGVLQGKGEEAAVYEERCRGQGARACEFIISKKPAEESTSTQRVKKLLLGD